MDDSQLQKTTPDRPSPTGDPPPAPKVVVSSPEDGKPTREARKHNRRRKFKNVPIWIETSAAIALIGITWTYTHYAGQQVRTAQNTLTEIIKQYPEIKKSADAAKSAADTAKEVSDNATKSFRISERPYVTVQTVEFDSPLEANKEIGLSVICDNSGHTPALRVGYVTAVFISDKKIGEPIAHEGATIIASGHPTKKHFIIEFSGPDLTNMVNGEAFRISGEIKYTDVFGEWHVTTHCEIYDGRQKKFKFCSLGNDIR
jgi:hypothetical protein